MRKRILVSGVLPLLCSTVFAQVIPQEGLVAYYKFDEPDAPFVTDYGPNGFHGEVAGIGIWDVGVVGQAMLFDGIGTYVNCGNDPLFDMTANGAITLMAWVHPFDAGNGEHNEWITKGDHAWALKQHSSSNMSEFFVYDPTLIGLGGNNWHVVRGVVMDSADYNGKWTHFAGTYDGVNLKIFHDGNLDSTVTSSPAFNVRAEPVHLGHNAERTDRYFNGFLDEVIIWNVALSDEQVKAIYESYPGITAVKQPD